MVDDALAVAPFAARATLTRVPVGAATTVTGTAAEVVAAFSLSSAIAVTLCAPTGPAVHVTS